MKPFIDLYCGAPIELESEQLFLGKLSADLLAQGQPALVFANFFPPRKPLQIDFLVVTAQCACHVELKNLTAPVVGGVNGCWSLKMPNSALSPLEAKNPYRQALDGKFALSDEMHRFAAAGPAVPRPPRGEKFYQHLESVVCVFPDLLPGSSVFEDHKVRVRGYQDLLTLLTTRQTNPGWTRDHWLAFAMHLGLVRTDPGDDHLPEARAAQQAVAEYARRFQDFHGRDLPALVPTTLEGECGAVATDALVETLLAGQHLQLVGPSGCGKSLLARHMALAALRGDRLPIIAPAREYDGKLSALLDRSVAHLHPDTATHFLQAAGRCGSPVALILDGFNECPRKWRKQLAKDLQAFALRWPAPILLTAQEAVAFPEPLSGKAWRFAPLTGEQKVAVLRSYAGDDLPVDAAATAEPFQTPYELSLVADCLAETGAAASRAALFDAYTRRRCEKTTDAAVVRNILCAVADRMRRRLVSSLPVREVWRISSDVVRREAGNTHLLSEALECGLLDARQGRCAFRHELLERFFQAEGLVDEHSAGGGLPPALALPRNRALTEFVVGGETDPAEIRRCLGAVADPAILADCLRGRCGEVARDAVAEDCGRLLRAAQRALEDIDVELTGGEPLKQLAITGGPAWSTYDRALMQAVGHVLTDGCFLDEVFRLVACTEERCRSALAEKAGIEGKLGPGDAMSVFAALYVFTSGDARACFPASTVYHACRFHRAPTGGTSLRDGLLRMADSLESRTPGELLLLCEMLRFAEPDIRPVVPPLLRACWRTGIYHLRLDALQMAQWNARGLEGEPREEVMAFLGTLHSRNLGLSTSIVEALLAYGLVESPVSAADVARDVAEILQSPDEPEAQERAYHAVANIFEEIYQEAFWDAIEALPRNDRVTLLTMAALGAPGYGSFTDWSLRELLALDDRRALPAFLRWATSIDTTSCFPQEATACFVLGVMGCARYLDEPPASAEPQSDVERAWQAYGSILFWLYKPGLSLPERQASAAPWWQRLRAEWPFEAVDPLLQMERADWKSGRADRRALDDFCTTFSDEVRGILEFGLANRAKLTGLFGRMPFREDETLSLIRWLGVVGDRRTVRLLEPLVDTPDMGPSVLDAVRRLKASLPGP